MSPKVIQLKEKLKKTNEHGLVLDIDETLAWTIGYWVEQLQSKFGNPENLSIKELIAKYRYTQDVPYWQTTEALEWMANARESDELQESLPLTENANHIVGKINKIIPIVGYITIRPEKVMVGTGKWLIKHDFPDVSILGRPNEMEYGNGNKWKAEMLHYLYPEVVGIVDDNPAVVNFLPDNYKGTVFLYDNIEHPRKDIAVIPCKTWDVVLEKVKSVYQRAN